MCVNGASRFGYPREKPRMISKWIGRYDYTVPDNIGKIVNVDGVGDRDTYNPSLCQYDNKTFLAFRCEDRLSNIDDVEHYNPSILFAEKEGDKWRLCSNITPFDMMEDPLFMEAKINGNECIVFGGVRAKLVSVGNYVVDTELYKGESLETLERQPFAVIKGMKDERLHQLPDGRFMLCRRPVDGKGLGRVVIHIIDNLEDLVSINAIIPPAVAELRGLYDDDWVGVNNIYILDDMYGTTWVGLLGHIAIHDANDHKHYASTTYKIKLDDLINGRTDGMKPTIIATRVNFENGPEKTAKFGDIVFPGSLEKIEGDQYCLWAGLSDARIGVLDVSDPFGFEK